MSQSLELIYPAATVADFPADWIAGVRAALKRDGQAARAHQSYYSPGDYHVIDVQSINTGEWMPLNLPTNSPRFATAADRDAVLEMLVGKEGK